MRVRETGLHKRILILLAAVMIHGCANRMNPEGGAKDVQAPVLKKAVPENSSLNFSGDRIVLEFDEYIQLADLNNQLVVSPLMDPLPEITAFKNRITIQLRDTLEANTTYLLSFGKSITDVHENNILEGFRYVFSTGSQIDSLFVKGRILDGATAVPVKQITVMLYRYPATPDSMVLNRKPDYFTRTADDGSYSLNNLASGSYVLVALDDKNGNYKYDDPGEEAMAFHDSVISLPRDTVIDLQLSFSFPEKLRVRKMTRIGKTAVQLVFNRPAENVILKERDGQAYTGKLYWNIRRDTLSLFTKDTLQDSLNLVISGNRGLADTIAMKMQYGKGSSREGGQVKFALQTVVTPATAGPGTDIVLNSVNPLRQAGFVSFEEDSVKLDSLKIEIDTADDRIARIRYKWIPGKYYKLKALPGTVSDIFGYSNDTLQWNFQVADERNAGELQVTLNGRRDSSVNYLLQLTTSDFNIIRQLTVDSGYYVFNYLIPGNYRLRMVRDINRNGRWDGSDFREGLQPEKVVISEEFQIRAAWTLEKEIVFP